MLTLGVEGRGGGGETLLTVVARETALVVRGASNLGLFEGGLFRDTDCLVMRDVVMETDEISLGDFFPLGVDSSSFSLMLRSSDFITIATEIITGLGIRIKLKKTGSRLKVVQSVTIQYR